MKPKPIRLTPARLWALGTCLFAAALFAGCASTTVTGNSRVVYERLPRPDHIYICDFGSSAADISSDSGLYGKVETSDSYGTPEQAAMGRQLGSGIAAQLADAIRGMGLPAERGVPGTSMQLNDIMLRGYLVSIDPGDPAKRMTIGFGSGGSELTTVVEGYQMTAGGLRLLGTGTVTSKGNKTPGAGTSAAGWAVTGSPVGLIVGGGMKVYGEASGSATIEGRARQSANEIADRLKVRFQEEGWIQ